MEMKRCDGDKKETETATDLVERGRNIGSFFLLRITGQVER